MYLSWLSFKSRVLFLFYLTIISWDQPSWERQWLSQSIPINFMAELWFEPRAFYQPRAYNDMNYLPLLEHKPQSFELSELYTHSLASENSCPPLPTHRSLQSAIPETSSTSFSSLYQLMLGIYVPSTLQRISMESLTFTKMSVRFCFSLGTSKAKVVEIK